MIGASSSQSGSAVLTWALAERPATVDPLYARTPADELAARQIHEPLVESLAGPFDFPRRLAGLAVSARPSADRTVWKVRLRPGVRFQDGTALNAEAVVANVDRWRASGVAPVSPAMLADAPRPDLVRFILPTPDPTFDRVLASPQLGIVSPRAIRQSAGGPLDPDRLPESGTGPFELRERTARSLLFARNTDWWGTEHGLGPGVDQIELRAVESQASRLALLRSGEVQVADLGAAGLRRVAGDPLLTRLREPGKDLGLERSVRGLEADQSAPSLNGAWLTGIDAG